MFFVKNCRLQNRHLFIRRRISGELWIRNDLAVQFSIYACPVGMDLHRAADRKSAILGDPTADSNSGLCGCAKVSGSMIANQPGAN